MLHRLTLTDGSQLVGTILSVDSTSISFQSALGVNSINLSSIASWSVSTAQIVDGRYYFPNPNATRLLFSPTGRTLKRGEGYISDYWLFFPGLAVGVTDWITIGGGMSIFPIVDFSDQLFFVTPKVAVMKSPRVNAAVGALVISLPSFDSRSRSNVAGIAYGVSTFGDELASWTAGLGYGFVNGDWARRPMVMIGGETRVLPSIAFVTENYYLTSESSSVGVLSGGIRFLGGSVSADLAIAGLVGDGGGCCVPFLGFLYKW